MRYFFIYIEVIFFSIVVKKIKVHKSKVFFLREIYFETSEEKYYALNGNEWENSIKEF